MDAKYIGLLCKIKDPQIKAVLTELVKDLEELKAQPQPVQRIELIGKPLRPAMPPPMARVNH